MQDKINCKGKGQSFGTFLDLPNFEHKKELEAGRTKKIHEVRKLQFNQNWHDRFKFMLT